MPASHDRILSRSDYPGSRILTREAASALCTRLAGTVVFTNGCFDLLHPGHVDYLHRASLLGDHLVIGLNSDASVRKIKGPPRPINTENDRAFVLASLAFVTCVTIFEEETPLQLIQALKPQILVKGGDWPEEKIVGRDAVSAAGGKVLSLPLLPGHSTSNIIQRILRAYGQTR